MIRKIVHNLYPMEKGLAWSRMLIPSKYNIEPYWDFSWWKGKRYNKRIQDGWVITAFIKIAINRNMGEI